MIYVEKKCMCHTNQLTGQELKVMVTLDETNMTFSEKAILGYLNHKLRSTENPHYLPHSNPSVALVSDSSMF